MNVLTLDIETMANKGWFWKTFKENIGTNQIEEPTFMLSWKAKWLGDKEVLGGPYDDHPEFLEELHALLCRADVVVTYNGDNFDLRHLNREFAKAGLPPVRPFASIDLYKIVKATFALPSNRLDYVCEYFLGKRKLETGGFELWKEVRQGNQRAWNTMLKYNERDVRLTEELYKFLRPWIRVHPYAGDTPEIDDSLDDYDKCPSCESRKLELDRPRRTRCFAIRIVHCQSCGNYFDGKRKKI